MKPWSYLLALLFIPLAACGMVLRKPAIEVTMINSTSRIFREARVHFGSNLCEWGTVVPTGNAGYMHYPHPITPEAELRWEEDGGRQVRKLDLKKIYPTGKSGQLVFTVFDDRVEVKFTEKTWTP